MRWLYLIFLVVFIAVIAVFVYQNQQQMSLVFGPWHFNATVALVSIAAYVLGMFTGWSVVGLVRRSIARVAESDRRESAGSPR